MQSKYMTNEHIMFRDSVREFIKRDIAPYHEQWEKDEIVPRDIWLKAGENGFFPQGDAKRSVYGCAGRVWRDGH